MSLAPLHEVFLHDGAGNRGLRMLVISCLPQNLAMQNPARKFGARPKFATGEARGKIIVELPTAQTIFAEFVEESLDFATALFDLQKRIFRFVVREHVPGELIDFSNVSLTRTCSIGLK